MPLRVYNLTGSPVVLATLTTSVPASGAPPARSVPVDVTFLLQGLRPEQYVALEVQRVAGTLVFEWAGGASFSTGALNPTMQAVLLPGAPPIKAAVRFATTAALAASVYANGVRTASANGAFPTVDGVVAIVGNRFIDKDHATATRRGWYEIVDLGSATTPWVIRRPNDADTSDKIIPGVITEVSEGTVNGDSVATLTTNGTSAGIIVLDTDNLAFSLASGSAASTAYVDAQDTAIVTDADSPVGGGLLTLAATFRFKRLTAATVVTLDAALADGLRWELLDDTGASIASPHTFNTSDVSASIYYADSPDGQAAVSSLSYKGNRRRILISKTNGKWYVQ